MRSICGDATAIQNYIPAKMQQLNNNNSGLLRVKVPEITILCKICPIAALISIFSTFAAFTQTEA